MTRYNLISKLFELRPIKFNGRKATRKWLESYISTMLSDEHGSVTFEVMLPERWTYCQVTRSGDSYSYTFRNSFAD